MGFDEREDENLRSVALENARAILRARQRADRELLLAKEALERKTKELDRSLAVLQATLEATSDGILVTDNDGRVNGFNARYLTMWALPRDIEGLGHSELAVQKGAQIRDPTGYLSRMREIYASPPAETQDVIELADGRVYERVSRLQYLEGRNIGRVWSFRDITAQKRAEAELKQQREWFQVTLSSIGDAVVTTDTQGKVTFLNPVAEKMTGWPASEARGMPLESVFKIVNEYTSEPVENPVVQVLREGCVVGLANHTVLLAKNGKQVAIEDSAAPIRDSSGAISGAVMVFHDVTARRLVEAALRDADRRKDEFLATLAHELRNPLAPIRQATIISKSAGASEAQKRWSHEVVERQVRHMSLLLDDLLDISRVTRGTLVLRPQLTDLASAIEAAVETARPLIDAKRHTLSIEITDGPIRFSADPLRLAQIFGNLLANAAKYTDAAGLIRLRAHCEPEEVVIKVSDSGIGFSEQAVPKLFEMFTQVSSMQDRSEGGLGIGLALTKGLVELHGGRVTAYSAGPGLGSEFTVRLPRPQTAKYHDGTSLPILQEPGAATKRILLADDNKDAAESLAILLRLQGYSVTMAHDGPQALAAFADSAPDVVLLDIGMPGLNGYDVARELRGKVSSSELKLIAITGWGQSDDKGKALAAGFDHHLTKPIELRQLLQLIEAPTQA